jgi:hypothetical protein
VKEGAEEGAAAGEEAREGHGVGSGRVGPGRVGSGGCGDEGEKRGRLQQIGLLRTARRTPAWAVPAGLEAVRSAALSQVSPHRTGLKTFSTSSAIRKAF